MEIIVEILKYGAPWALVVMGAVLSVNPPKREDRRKVRLWIIAFAVVGALVTFAQFYSDAEDLAAQDALRIELTGGDYFAFVRVREVVEKNGGNFISITTTGSLPNLHIGFYPLTLDGKPQGERWVHFDNLPPTTFHPEIALSPGRYRIDFLMGNKKWIEHLEFERSAKGVVQVFFVEQEPDGKVIYREPSANGVR